MNVDNYYGTKRGRGPLEFDPSMYETPVWLDENDQPTSPPPGRGADPAPLTDQTDHPDKGYFEAMREERRGPALTSHIPGEFWDPDDNPDEMYAYIVSEGERDPFAELKQREQQQHYDAAKRIVDKSTYDAISNRDDLHHVCGKEKHSLELCMKLYRHSVECTFQRDTYERCAHEFKVASAIMLNDDDDQQFAGEKKNKNQRNKRKISDNKHVVFDGSDFDTFAAEGDAENDNDASSGLGRYKGKDSLKETPLYWKSAYNHMPKLREDNYFSLNEQYHRATGVGRVVRERPVAWTPKDWLEFKEGKVPNNPDKSGRWGNQHNDGL